MLLGTGIRITPMPPGFTPGWDSGAVMVMTVIAGAAVLLTVVRIVEAIGKRRNDPLPLPRRAAKPRRAPGAELAELERRAGLALVASDGRVTAEAAETDYVRAMDGDDVADALAANLEGARTQLAEAFALQRDAGSTVAGEQARRSAYRRILELTGQIDASLAGVRTSLERLRALGARASEEASALGGELEQLDAAAATASSRLDDARLRYSQAAIEPGAAAIGEASTALAGARAQLASLSAGAAGPAALSGLRIESARAGLRRAAEGISIGDGHVAELGARDLAVAEGIAALERDVEQARALGSTRLAAVADRFAAEALALRDALAAVDRDPAELGRRVVRADAAIDAELRASAESARTVERTAAERSSALAGARMLVSTAANALASEPVDAAARIRRDEALILLGEAREALAQASRADLPPSDARDRADSATHLARRAMAIARDGIAHTPAADGRMFDLASGGDGPVSEFLAGLLDRASAAIDDASAPPGELRPPGATRAPGTAWTWGSGSP